ncbi:MAG TPA: alpha/beta fold hydrolase [Ideonella sp.]|uniref:esterase/lipase family protein n=1 Tax=Ideonella sp. TaxID=1929293 RepID=UPI002E3545C0|nr:alpha/beta fold hydrolase [Ideonella sp.]HEX5683922.1 alpha/beta fold hydrolase [Ideonella sp.]
MLARLQQLLVLGWCMALLAAAILPWRAGYPVGSLVAVAVVLASHALWLLVTFALMRWHNRRDAAPPVSWRQWWAAWWGEVRMAPRVFGWRQPFASNAERDFLPADARGRAGVVLVHGFVCNRGLWTPWLAQLRAEGVPFVAVNLEPVFGSIDDYPAIIEAAVKKLEACTGEKPLLVGHSMGGLAIRAWLARQAADGRIRGVITIGTPHRGTWLATLSQFGRNTREMRPGSDWLCRLEAGETASRRELFLCIYGHGDNIVFPASHAVLPGARQLHVAGTAHIDLLHHPEVVATLWQALGRPGPRDGA